MQIQILSQGTCRNRTVCPAKVDLCPFICYPQNL